MTNVLVPLAQGCEELEAVTIIDLLRRASINVISAGLDEGIITASRGCRLLADTTLNNVMQKSFDMIVLPGGLPGADNLGKDPRIQQLLLHMNQNKKYIAAICAAPRVLAHIGLLDNKQATCFPGAINSEQFPQINLTDDAVVKDHNIITSRGPGTAMDFSLTLIECLSGRETRMKVESALQRSLSK